MMKQTRKRNDNHSTEFGLWLREQKDIASNLGYVATNLDYIWENYKTKYWMLIEEKRYMAELTYAQGEQYKNLFNNIVKSDHFKGIHLLQFENTNPEDGKIYLNGKEITKEQLLMFLKFEA